MALNEGGQIQSRFQLDVVGEWPLDSQLNHFCEKNSRLDKTVKPQITAGDQSAVAHQQQPPHLVEKFQSVSVNEGDSLTLFCKAAGDGVQMQW